MSVCAKLPRVNTRKEFMDYLDDATNLPKREDDGAGKTKELKSYIIESDAEIQREFKTRNMVTARVYEVPTCELW